MIKKATFLVSLLFLIGCSKSEYEKLVKREMDKNIRYDSIFLGHVFGQTKRKFFDVCWELNKKKQVTNGAKGMVQYILPQNNDKPKIHMLFYGNFNEDNIMTGMDVEFYHPAWAIWNKELQADKLRLAIKDTLLAWFPGNGFIKVRSKKLKEDLFVKIDGNRRIIIEPNMNTKDVSVTIDDLRFILEEHKIK